MVQVIDINEELYVPILTALSVSINQETAGISLAINENPIPCVVAKKNVVLPTKENLRSLNPATTIIFHPMSENVARGDSQIQNLLKYIVTICLTTRFIILAEALLTLAVNKAYHSDFDSEQLELLTMLPEVDGKTLNNFTDAMRKVDMDKVKIFNVYNKRNGKYGGVSYNRVSVLSMPLLKEILEPAKSSVWGKSVIRKRDINDYKLLFDYILPGWETDETYWGTSDVMSAPSFQALMRMFGKVQNRFNYLADKYKKLLDKIADKPAAFLRVDMDWLSRLDDLGRYDNVIPPMEGNTGSTDVKATQATVVSQPKAIPPASTPTVSYMQNIDMNVAQPSQSTQPVTAPVTPAVQPATQPYVPPVQPAPVVPVQNNGGFIGQPSIPATYTAGRGFIGSGAYSGFSNYGQTYQAQAQPTGYYTAQQQAQTQPVNHGFIGANLYSNTNQNQGYYSTSASTNDDPIAEWNANTAPVNTFNGFGFSQPSGFITGTNYGGGYYR